MQHPSPPLFVLGPAGTFSDKAATILGRVCLPWYQKTFVSDITATFSKVVQHSDAIGIIALENSVAGAVDSVQSLLVAHPVEIIHELSLTVDFKMLVRGTRYDATRLYVHPVTERQCATAIAQCLAHVTVESTRSNTDSADRVLNASEPCVALVPVDYVPPADPRVHTLPLPSPCRNTTRFAAIRRGTSVEPDFNQRKLSLLIRPHADRPGLLCDLLAILKRHGLNVSRIHSHPIGSPWEYLFFIDIVLGRGAECAWRELQRGDWDVRILGSYSRIPE